MWITVRNKETLTTAFEPAHTAICTALDTDIRPKVIVAQCNFQNIQCTCIFITFFAEITCLSHILYLPGSCEAFVFLYTCHILMLYADLFLMQCLFQSFYLLLHIHKGIPFTCIADTQIFRSENFLH